MTDTPDSSQTREPEALLLGINRSIFTMALVVSLAAHALVLGTTSFSLYSEWAELGIRSEEYGFHTPSILKTIRSDLAREQEDAARREREEERLAAQRERAMQEAREEDAREPTPARPQNQQERPVEPEIEPLPRRPFSLDDIDLGI